MIKNIKIAVDGTASSGKSTVMKIVSDKLNLKFIDTGLMYRAFTKYCLNNNIDLKNTSEVSKMISSFSYEFKDNEEIHVNNENYSNFLSDLDVVENIKYIANNTLVRNYMVEEQKSIASKQSIIMVGRDITTVVLPNADLKIYFDCSIEARAKRRFNQNKINNIEPNIYKDIYQSIENRDKNDKNREQGSLKIAKDSWTIDTSDISIDEAVILVINKIKSL
ncbi:cytidylate kinase [Spiroplasma litorale]|uniref:Cytidylate kinase n=1 Tax=Spiroplasma litorale TaxID=216942 RepID=A0A0K1W2P7_9MOLU|nr:(d)CMP kinase [Spiroplasma litorale]AKX34448.1 cytidylate kinase [Spiroplasma litorale]